MDLAYLRLELAHIALADHVQGRQDPTRRSQLTKKYEICRAQAVHAKKELVVQREAIGLRNAANDVLVNHLYPDPPVMAPCLEDPTRSLFGNRKTSAPPPIASLVSAASKGNVQAQKRRFLGYLEEHNLTELFPLLFKRVAGSLSDGEDVAEEDSSLKKRRLASLPPEQQELLYRSILKALDDFQPPADVHAKLSQIAPGVSDGSLNVLDPALQRAAGLRAPLTRWVESMIVILMSERPEDPMAAVRARVEAQLEEVQRGRVRRVEDTPRVGTGHVAFIIGEGPTEQVRAKLIVKPMQCVHCSDHAHSVQ